MLKNIFQLKLSLSHEHKFSYLCPDCKDIGIWDIRVLVKDAFSIPLLILFFNDKSLSDHKS